MTEMHGSNEPPLPEEETGDSERDSLVWRRNFLARLIPDLQERRLRTRDGEADTTEETLQRLRLRLSEIERRLEQPEEAETTAT